MPPQNTTETNATTPKPANGTGTPQATNGNGNVKETMKLEPPTATVVVPPDGGWGWVVMIASFVCNVIVDGIVMSCGMYKEDIAKEFNASSSEVALMCSLLSGFYLIAGPFASALANKWGFRPVTIIGACIGSVAFGVCYFATSLGYLYAVYGIIGGIGFCFIYIPSVVTVGYYFEKWRALATGIAMCGSGVGTFIFAPMNSYLVATYGWRVGILIQSAIVVVCALCGCTYRPLKPVQVTMEEEPEEKEKMLPFVFTKPLPEGRFAFSVPNSSHNTWIGASNNTLYPTAAEVFRCGAAATDRRPSSDKSTVNHTNISSTTKKLEQFSKAQRRSSGTTTPDETVPAPPVFAAHHLHKELNTVGEAEEENDNETLLEEEVKPVVLTERRHTVSGRRPTLPAKCRNRKRGGDGTAAERRPMYRDDIFFSGSLVRIPQYQSQSSLGYHMSVTRLPTKNDVDEEEDLQCAVCPEAVRRTLATMLDTSLLKSPSFMLLALSGFLTMMGFFIPFMFMKDRATKAGMDNGIAALTVAAIGISNTIARIVCGLLSSFKGVNALHLNNVAITAGGIATIFSGYSITAGYQFAYASIFGIAIACFSALRSLIAVDLMGLEKLTNAFGILMLFQGLAAVIGSPIAGMLFDATQSYDYSFYFAGTLITISAILCYPLNYVNRWEKNRNAKNEKDKIAA